MAAVFHFYDSGEEDDEDEEVGPATGLPATLQTGGLGGSFHTSALPPSYKPSVSRTTHSSKQTEQK